MNTGHVGNWFKTSGEFWTVVREKDGEGNFVLSLECWSSIIYRQAGQEYFSYNKIVQTTCICYILSMN
jgi:hypothetical protein